MDSKISFLNGKNSGSSTNGNTGNRAKIILKTSYSQSTTGAGVMAYHGFN